MAQRTITLTGRPPVRIEEEKWPLLATASGKDYDGEHEFQSFRHTLWDLRVRQHEDGRTIVYAVYKHTTAWQKERGYEAKRGVMLPSGATEEAICQAVQEVCADIATAECRGSDASRWPTLAAECIADMPAESLD